MATKQSKPRVVTARVKAKPPSMKQYNQFVELAARDRIRESVPAAETATHPEQALEQAAWIKGAMEASKHYCDALQDASDLSAAGLTKVLLERWPDELEQPTEDY